MADVKKYVGMQIKKYRKLRNMTQKQLGAKIGVQHNTISSYESGTNEPEQSILFELAKALDLRVDDFFPKSTPAASPVIRTSEDNGIIQKYNALDEHGKRSVRTLLELEYERCTKPHLTVVAAHSDDYSEEQQKLMEEDLDDLEKLHAKRKK
ncbi:helix-turn-helix domain-containing protein [Paenibacillus contaminans]|uniref:HTH cro/C1-type domain-containing protein n=1 Tax=Paenibacillus contaminans TaxID=450362 RepID=A0A329MJ54_9BACL|nr:helix-turn-helix transcriptional regulator [Paenibacillus contaminans]RAV19730.1 hypothetical protein DQG23_20000 [Paenibacillus contaminans]